MTVFDYAVLTIICLSVALSVMRGFVREVLALIGWVAAFVAATTLSGPVADLMASNITDQRLRAIVAFVAVFFGTLLLAALLAYAFSSLLKKAGLALEDRVLGGVFGLARGILIVTVIVLLGGLTGMPKQPAWNNAMLSPPFEAMATTVKAWLPVGLSRYITYD